MNNNLSQLSARIYTRSNYSRAAVCGIMHTKTKYIYDCVRWETFNDTDLREYLLESVEKAVPQLERIAYLDHPYTKEDEQNLLFMIESLLHARHTVEEFRH